LDGNGVHQSIKALYKLPDFGRDLEKIVKVNEKAAESVFREKTCNLIAGSHWVEKHTERKSIKGIAEAVMGWFPRS
jgi:hypothetical protein